MWPFNRLKRRKRMILENPQPVPKSTPIWVDTAGPAPKGTPVRVAPASTPLRSDDDSSDYPLNTLRHFSPYWPCFFPGDTAPVVDGIPEPLAGRFEGGGGDSGGGGATNSFDNITIPDSDTSASCDCGSSSSDSGGGDSGGGGDCGGGGDSGGGGGD